VKSRITQRSKILQLLREREGGWVPSYELAGIALQYGARVLELRRAGYNIENRMQEVDGQTYGAFRLVPTGDQTSLFDAGLEARPRTQGHWLESQPRRSL
jgi:hypothetical protein